MGNDVAADSARALSGPKVVVGKLLDVGDFRESRALSAESLRGGEGSEGSISMLDGLAKVFGSSYTLGKAVKSLEAITFIDHCISGGADEGPGLTSPFLALSVI